MSRCRTKNDAGARCTLWRDHQGNACVFEQPIPKATSEVEREEALAEFDRALWAAESEAWADDRVEIELVKALRALRRLL